MQSYHVERLLLSPSTYKSDYWTILDESSCHWGILYELIIQYLPSFALNKHDAALPWAKNEETK